MQCHIPKEVRVIKPFPFLLVMRTATPPTHPTIRRLCKELGASAAASHILAGVTAILTLPRPSLSNDRENKREDKKDKIPALIAAVYFFVHTRLSGRKPT